MAFALTAGLPSVAHAQESAAHPAGKEAPATRIAVDEESDVIRFFVAGEQAMRLDSAGLHVRGNIKYGGKVRDVGDPAIAEGGVDAK